MTSQCYLMSVSEFWDGVEGERLLKAALEKVDDERRKKVEAMKAVKPQAACVGAGLLLQLAVQEALTVAGGADAGGTDGTESDLSDLVSTGMERLWRSAVDMKADSAADAEGFRVYSALHVMELVERPIELVMDYGEKGKPYLREYPLFFNLSHSGEYVVCAVSDREIGVDIQKCSNMNVMRIAKRFFSEEECRALETCETGEERRQFFFRLWVRKEAYGKFLGKGIMGVVSENLLPDESCRAAEKELLWREWSFPEGYKIAMCQLAQMASAAN